MWNRCISRNQKIPSRILVLKSNLTRTSEEELWSQTSSILSRKPTWQKSTLTIWKAAFQHLTLPREGLCSIFQTRSLRKILVANKKQKSIRTQKISYLLIKIFRKSKGKKIPLELNTKKSNPLPKKMILNHYRLINHPILRPTTRYKEFLNRKITQGRLGTECKR